MAEDIKLTEQDYVRFADGKGSPAVHLKQSTSSRNTVSPLSNTMKDPDHSLELDRILLPNENSKGERLCHGALKMLSRGKGASIFDAVNLKEADFGAVDKELLTAKDKEGFTLLHHASRCNKVDEVIWLLDKGVEIDALGNYGLTALNIAVRNNSTEVVKILLQKGADPSIPDEENETPLLFAARRGYNKIAALLLKDSRTEVNRPNSAEFTPFHGASGGGDRSLCEMLLKHGADLFAKTGNLSTALHFVAFNANTGVCELLISTAKNKCPSLKDFLDAKDVEDNTALHICCRKGCSGVAELLLRYGADYEAITGVNFSTPLHLTAMYGHEEITKLLTSCGADIFRKDGHLQTPLHRAAIFNQVNIVKILLDNGADKEDKDMMDMTPFLGAVVHGSKETAELLLKQGTDIMAVDSEHNSCLHLGVKHKRVEIVKMLLVTEGIENLMKLRNNELQTFVHIAASVKQKEILDIVLRDDFWLKQRDKNERIPLHVAAENGSLECVESLLSCQALFIYGNDRDKDGRSPLHLAAYNKHLETCAVLMSKGSDVTARDNQQSTPLHLAVEVGSLETVRLLLTPMLPNTLEVKDKDQNTPLHVAGMHNRVEILKFLMDQGADVAARNSKNMTCLDEAIEWNSVEVAETLVRHKRWKEVLCNTPVDQIKPMEKLIEKLPGIAEIVLDQCISYSDLPTNHPDFTVSFNFLPLDPADDTSGHHYFFGPACMAKYRRESLLDHCVTQTLLNWKWLVLGKYVNYFNFAVFIIFLVVFSVFIVQQRDKVNFSSGNAITEAGEDSKSLPGVIFAFLVVSLLKEIFQIFWQRLEYFKDYINFVDLSMYMSTLIFILPYLANQELYGDVRVQWTFGTLALLLCYTNWCLSLRRVTSLSLYITMYIEVLLTFAKVILIFAVLLLGFTLVFFVLLKEEDNFSSVWFSMVKVFVMMLGEVDYTDMLSDNVVNSAKVPGTSILYVPFPELSYVLFVVFVLSVSVVLMNLLVGLAVGDIDSIQKTATLRNLIDQALLVDSIRKRYPTWILRLTYKDYLEFKLNQNTTIKRFVLSGTGLSNDDFLDIISKNDSSQNEAEADLDEYDQHIIKRQEEQIKTLQATVDAQSKLLIAIAKKLGINE